MSENTKKGRALERATHAIEEMVLRAHIDIGDGKFTIERNMHFRPHGDLNEIDLLVTIRPGTPEEVRHVFECKNCKKKVSKNDVVVFAAKVRDLQAQRGTIVARDFTRDARQRALHEGIAFAHFTDEIWSAASLAKFSATSLGFESIQVTCKRRNDTDSGMQPDWVNSVCQFGRGVVSFCALVDWFLEDWRGKHLASLRLLEGTRGGTDRIMIEFDQGELRVEAWEIAELRIDFAYSYSNRPAKLVSCFSIENRGRYARFECDPDPFDQRKVAMEILSGETP